MRAEGQTRQSWLPLFAIYANALNETYIIFSFQFSTLRFYSVDACQFGSTMLNTTWTLPPHPMQFFTHWTLQNLRIWASVFIVTNTRGQRPLEADSPADVQIKVSVFGNRRSIAVFMKSFYWPVHWARQIDRSIYFRSNFLDLQGSPDL
jgi:hypothetical protein